MEQLPLPPREPPNPWQLARDIKKIFGGPNNRKKEIHVSYPSFTQLPKDLAFALKLTGLKVIPPDWLNS